MKTRLNHWTICAGIAISALSAASYNAIAADTTRSSAAQERYEQDRAACISGKSHQDRATCLKEAGAAFDAAKRGELADASSTYRKNALLRCKNLPEKDLADCRARIEGDSTTTSGDALDGGILRERVTREPAVAPTPAP